MDDQAGQGASGESIAGAVQFLSGWVNLTAAAALKMCYGLASGCGKCLTGVRCPSRAVHRFLSLPPCCVSAKPMKKKDIEFLDVLSLRGPNIWTYRPVLEAWIDIGELEDFPSNTLPGFNERLSAWLPSLIEHRCSIGERGGFLQRLRDGTWPVP